VFLESSGKKRYRRLFRVAQYEYRYSNGGGTKHRRRNRGFIQRAMSNLELFDHNEEDLGEEVAD
jgi:hypothetical protein